MTEEKLMALLKDMSLKEKIGQMMQLDVSCFKNEGPVTGSEVDQGIAGEDLTLAGSILGAIGTQEIKGLQKRCMEKRWCLWRTSLTAIRPFFLSRWP